MSKNYIDFNQPLNYPIQWLWESSDSRWEYQRLIHRADLAMEGRPWRNIYQEEMTSILNGLDSDDKIKAEKTGCLKVPEGRSYILRKAVENRANQMASGVDTYEYQINDKFGIIEDDTEDLLAATCHRDYIENKLELLSPVFSNDLTNYGLSAVIVRYDQENGRNIVERVNPKNCWWDTKYSTTGRERFRGYSQMISWACLKEIIKHDKDKVNLNIQAPRGSVFNKDGKLDKNITISNKKIRTLNDLDIYVQDLNRLAGSGDLQNGGDRRYDEYTQDLRSCYNTGWYKTMATSDVAKTKSGYNGDDVELTIIYDLTRKIEFKIVNRRFIISANHDAFCRKVAYKINDPVTDEVRYRIEDFNLECPLKFQFDNWTERDKFCHPVSPTMKFLDVHDELCTWRAKRDHVSKILATLRIETNGGDASSLKKVLNIMGIVLDDIQGDINSINFNYDYSPIDSQIAYLEKTITEGLHAYDMFDAMQSMGDRASAAESGMAIGAVAQGLATHQNSVMALYADIARQCIANRVVYSNQSQFFINNIGGNSPVTIQQMALDAVISVKSKLSRKVAERTTAANALAALGTMRNDLTEEGMSALLEQALFGSFPRKIASSFIKKRGASAQEIANAQRAAQNQAQMLQQNEQMYLKTPLPYEVENARQQLSLDDMDQVIMQLSAEQGNEGISSEPLEMISQDGAIATGLAGLTPEVGGQFANPSGYFG